MPTLIHRLVRWAEADPGSPCQSFKSDGDWKFLSASDVRDRVFQLALYLENRGIRRGEVASIFSINTPGWVQAELACHLIGVKTAGIYPNSMPKDCAYILEHTESRVLFVRDRKAFDRLGGKLPETIALIIVFEGAADFHSRSIAMEDAIKQGEALLGEKHLGDYVDRLDAKEGLFLIYTSGTTGNPKGVLLSHDNLVFTGDAVTDHLELPKERGRLASFLPLSHVAEKIQNLGVGISLRYCAYYLSGIDKVSQELPEVRPTALLSVPRLWEKMMEGVNLKVAQAPAPRKQLMEWALATGAEVARRKFGGEAVGLPLWGQYQVADRLVLGKIREALGLGAATRVASGAAALPAAVSRWFRSIGVEILEDYGQSESTGVITMTLRGRDCAGTVGRPPRGLECKIADDGEICTRGRHVSQGYFKNEEATREAFKDGWLCTGDLGEWTETGMLKIRGRKKEIMKTSGGKMIAPIAIEEQIKACPLVAQVCLTGDGRKYFTAIITLTESVLKGVHERGQVIDGVVRDAEVLDPIRLHLDAVNRSLASYERIKAIAVLPHDFTVEGGELTPTLKMKRSVIEQKYRKQIDQMYGGDSGE